VNHLGVEDPESPPFPDTDRLLLQDSLASALSCVFHGADSTDAAALLDALDDHGLKVVRS
jgi:hypothetical protein